EGHELSEMRVGCRLTRRIRAGGYQTLKSVHHSFEIRCLWFGATGYARLQGQQGCCHGVIQLDGGCQPNHIRVRDIVPLASEREQQYKDDLGFTGKFLDLT